MARPDQTQLNLTVSTLANTGGAGGTMYYVNLGGIKILWFKSAFLNIPANSYSNYPVNLPSGFFSTIQSVSTSNSGVGGFSAQTVTQDNGSSSTSVQNVGIGNAQGSAAATYAFSMIIIGT
jgi:hypothetical protein